MNAPVLAAIVSIILVGSAAAADSTSGAIGGESAAAAEGPAATGDEDAVTGASGKDLSNVCFFAGTPPADVRYSVIRKLRAGKGTYEGVKDVLPKLAAKAQKVGADAIIDFEGAQRFGMLPWRIVHPVVRGVAVRWADCSSRSRGNI
jgi:hypothetical protein